MSLALAGRFFTTEPPGKPGSKTIVQTIKMYLFKKVKKKILLLAKTEKANKNKKKEG